MNHGGNTQAQAKNIWSGIVETAIKVITKPAEFFRTMPKTGGFGDPLVFMIVLGVAAGLVQAILGLFHLGMKVSAVMALASIILTPIMTAIFGFVGAAILFVIWKLMGSQESYETAYRCAAYGSAIVPITALLGIIPYVGSIIGLAWWTFLLVTASVETHRLKAQAAWLVFGVIAALLALMSIGGQIKARRMARSMEEWSRQYGGASGSEMTPEEAGRAAAAFMKGLQEQMEREEAKARAAQQKE